MDASALFPSSNPPPAPSSSATLLTLLAATASPTIVTSLAPPDSFSTQTVSPSSTVLASNSSSYSSTWTFTQGFILGQAFFLILCGIFIRYVVFEDAKASRARRKERDQKVVMSTTNVPPPSSNELLDKVGYDMSVHGSESSDWINVLFAQMLQGYRDDLLGEGGEEGARKHIERLLNPSPASGSSSTGGGAVSWLDPITVTSLSLGNSYPLLSNARIRPADGHGRLRAEVDIDYTDAVHLSIATSLLVNFPRPRFAVLPVALGVELIGIGGTMTIQVHHAKDLAPHIPLDSRRHHLHLSLLPDFHLNVKATSLLGSRAKLQDIPKLEQIVISRLRAGIQDKVVWPKYIGVGLPRLVSEGVEGKEEKNGSPVPGATMKQPGSTTDHRMPKPTKSTLDPDLISKAIAEAQMCTPPDSKAFTPPTPHDGEPHSTQNGLFQRRPHPHSHDDEDHLDARTPLAHPHSHPHSQDQETFQIAPTTPFIPTSSATTTATRTAASSSIGDAGAGAGAGAGASIVIPRHLHNQHPDPNFSTANTSRM